MIIIISGVLLFICIKVAKEWNSIKKLFND